MAADLLGGIQIQRFTSGRQIVFGQTHVKGLGDWLNPLEPDPTYGGFNMALHVGDQPQRVLQNRLQLMAQLAQHGAQDVLWLTQVHGTTVWPADQSLPLVPPVADASVTSKLGRVLTSQTADCLPVVMASADGAALAVAHAGWRGLVAGVIEATAQAMAQPPAWAWFGTAIGPCAFEVGPEVKAAFLAAALPTERRATEAAFVPSARREHANLYALARIRLHRLGLSDQMIQGDEACSVQHPLAYSYRRQSQTGRMVTFAFIQPSEYS